MEWKFEKRIKSFPINLVNQANPKAIFSPNFERFLDYDAIEKEFKLVSTYDAEAPIRIPKGLVSQEISDRLHSLTEQEFLEEFRKRFMWHSENCIRILSFVD